jgi:hypothetical protein
VSDSYIEGLKAELAGHRAAGRDDRAALVVAELRKLGQRTTEKAVAKGKG